MFTTDFLLRRAVRIVPVDDDAIDYAVTQIDNIISQIEGCALHENTTGNIPNNWDADIVLVIAMLVIFVDFVLVQHNIVGLAKHLRRL